MIPFPDKKYNIIYADPPWSYTNYKANYSEWKGKHGGVRMAGCYYDLMTTEDICKLPVNDITDKNCALFLWVTNPLLQDGLDVIKSWGFRYITVAFTWIKRNPGSNKLKIGLGNYTRPSSELILLGMKGSLKVINKSVFQCQYSEVRRHSEKPHLFRDKIIQLFGDLPRIELFSRNNIPGWDSWGNQIPLIQTLD